MNAWWKPVGALIALSVAAPVAADTALRASALKAFGMIESPSSAAISSPEATLGRALFWDERLSLDGKTACASCHKDHGADARTLSIDAKGQPTGRHSPTVFNSMAQPNLRWLADRRSGAELAEGLITGPLGFPSKQAGVDKMVASGYSDACRAVYRDEPQPVTAANYARALQAYQATLMTPAPFDRFLAGDDRALTDSQMRGLRAFMEIGCAACHGGPLVGGTMTAKFGIRADYWTETQSVKHDVGRHAITKKDEDMHVFRVPMLRNVARTAPYFHDGSVATLERAVGIMAKLQLGRDLDPATTTAIVAFLESLGGESPRHFAPPGR